VSLYNFLLYETDLLSSLREYHLYSQPKPTPCRSEAVQFTESQAFRKDKARFSLTIVSYKQFVDSAVIYFDTYACLWNVVARMLARCGVENEVTLFVSHILP
jgi:hypothetical protein